MKHILNDLSNEEKNNIREQHTGGMKVMTENFSKLINSKLGNSKPLVNEEMKEGKSSPIKELKNDIHRALTQKMSKTTSSGEQGKFNHEEVEKDLNQILDDIQDVVRRYRK
jgi:hypothetical protein